MRIAYLALVWSLVVSPASAFTPAQWFHGDSAAWNEGLEFQDVTEELQYERTIHGLYITNTTDSRVHCMLGYLPPPQYADKMGSSFSRRSPWHGAYRTKSVKFRIRTTHNFKIISMQVGAEHRIEPTDLKKTATIQCAEVD